MVLKIGIPKGSLEKSTFELFKNAGFPLYGSERSLYPISDDPDLSCVLVRAQEMAKYVSQGQLDVGLTGQDWIREQLGTTLPYVEIDSDVLGPEHKYSNAYAVCDLVYSKQRAQKIKWVLAVPEDSPFEKPQDLDGKHIATELLNTTKNYFDELGVDVTVEFSWGATEVKPPELCDAIVDVTETGTSLKANRLRIIDTVMESNTQLIVNAKSWEDPIKREKVSDIAILLQSAMEARGRVGLIFNIKNRLLDEVLSELPSLRYPTVSPIADSKWVTVTTVADERDVRKLIPNLKRKGAEGIVEYPLNKLVV